MTAKTTKRDLYSIRPLRWVRNECKTIFGWMRCDSHDYDGRTILYLCDPVYQEHGRYKTVEQAKAAAERWYKGQLRKALRRVGSEWETQAILERFPQIIYSAGREGRSHEHERDVR